LKWDRWVAYALVLLGAAYAGYSGMHYLFKLRVVQPLRVSEAGKASVALAYAAATPEKKPESLGWVVVPKGERPQKGEHFADLLIPRLHALLPVIEGTQEEELERGVGHYADSVLPGEPDNSVLSGHRDTVFRRIGELKKGDELWVRTKKGTFVYTVTKTWVTTPDDRTVIVPLGRPVLTLTTCYPFTYFGPAPRRYIIRAEWKERIVDSSQ
jgi:sortase A